MVTVGVTQAPINFDKDPAYNALREFILNQLAAADVALDNFMEALVWVKGPREDICMAVLDHTLLSILRNSIYSYDNSFTVNMSTFGERMTYDRPEDVYRIGTGDLVKYGKVSKEGSIRFIVGIRILPDNQQPLVFHDLMSLSHLSCGYYPQE
jgi:hypothetical protein